MDVVAFGVAGIGLMLAEKGLALPGGVAYFAALAAFPIALARRPRVTTVLPYSFVSHVVVTAVGIVAFLIGGNGLSAWVAGGLGFLVYHYVCVSLREKRVRYGRIVWSTAEAASEPVVYWSWVGIFGAVAAVTLTMFFLDVARRS